MTPSVPQRNPKILVKTHNLWTEVTEAQCPVCWANPNLTNYATTAVDPLVSLATLNHGNLCGYLLVIGQLLATASGDVEKACKKLDKEVSDVMRTLSRHPWDQQGVTPGEALLLSESVRMYRPLDPLFHLRNTLWLGLQMSNILLLGIIVSFCATLFGLYLWNFQI